MDCSLGFFQTLLPHCFQAQVTSEAFRGGRVLDLIVFALAATGSLMAGVLLNLFGWQWVNLLALPILALAFGVLGWYARTLSTQEAAEATPS